MSFDVGRDVVAVAQLLSGEALESSVGRWIPAALSYTYTHASRVVAKMMWKPLEGDHCRLVAKFDQDIVAPSPRVNSSGVAITEAPRSEEH